MRSRERMSPFAPRKYAESGSRVGTLRAPKHAPFAERKATMGVLVNPGGLPTVFATRGLGGLLFYQGDCQQSCPLDTSLKRKRRTGRLSGWMHFLRLRFRLVSGWRTWGRPWETVPDLYQKSGVCIRLTTMGTNATCINTRSCRNSNRRKSAKNWLVNVYHQLACIAL